MPQIIPALLPKNLDELQIAIKKISFFSKQIQLDIADGKLVKNNTVDLKKIVEKKHLFDPLFLEVHLMVDGPIEYFSDCQKLNAKRVIFHYEAFKNIDYLIKTINQGKKFDFEIGVAINPPTPTELLETFVDKINFFLFLSVNPGWQGQAFIPEVLEKIKSFKKKYPKKKIEIDGGVNDQNIKKIVDAGVDYIVVGSFIIKSEDPEEKFLLLEKKIR